MGLSPRLRNLENVQTKNMKRLTGKLMRGCIIQASCRDLFTSHLDGYIPFWTRRIFTERVVRPKNTEQNRCTEIIHSVDYTLKMDVTRVVLA